MKQKQKKIKCKQCNRVIKRKRTNTKYCSKTCARTALKQQKNKWRVEHNKTEKDYVQAGYRLYANIKARTTRKNHPQFSVYGAKGIRLKISVNDFLKFLFSRNTCEMCNRKLSDLDRRKKNGRTVDRIDSSKNYELGNLRLLCRSCNASIARKRKGAFL